MSQIAIIPARGGSKRISKKNIRLFHGKPIIAYAIEECYKSELFSRVIVSTDDRAIAQVAQNFGAEVFFRLSPEISSDEAPVIEVIKEVINLEDLEQEASAICCVFPCTPLLTQKSLAAGFRILESNDVDFVFPVFNSGLAISRSLRINHEGNIQMVDENFENTPTNLISENLFDAGQYYWGMTNTWINSKSILAGKNLPLLIGKLDAIDIDNEEDWQLAEILFARLIEGEINE